MNTVEMLRVHRLGDHVAVAARTIDGNRMTMYLTADQAQMLASVTEVYAKEIKSTPPAKSKLSGTTIIPSE